MKTRLKLKNRSHRYGIKRPRPRHGHKYSKYNSVNMYQYINMSQYNDGYTY